MNALVVIETLTPAIFSQKDGIDSMLEKLEADVRAVATDVSTPAGRKAIASLAHKVARSKTAFDGMGKDLAAEWKGKAKAIDTERARVRDRLEALQAEVRKPLDDYEAAEAKRIANHQSALQAIIDLGTFSSETPSSSEVVAALAAFDEIPERDWQEFKQKFGAARGDTFAKLHALKSAALSREAEAAELARLRQEQADRERRERDEKIAADAAARATRDAELKAAQEATRVANETAERERKVEQDRLKAIARAEKAESDAAEALAKADADRVAAIDAERKLVADAQAAEAAETARREADKAHRKTVNSAALAALTAAGVPPEHGIRAITAIVRGEVPNITIRY